MACEHTGEKSREQTLFQASWQSLLEQTLAMQRSILKAVRNPAIFLAPKLCKTGSFV